MFSNSNITSTHNAIAVSFSLDSLPDTNSISIKITSSVDIIVLIITMVVFLSQVSLAGFEPANTGIKIQCLSTWQMGDITFVVLSVSNSYQAIQHQYCRFFEILFPNIKFIPVLIPSIPKLVIQSAQHTFQENVIQFVTMH